MELFTHLILKYWYMLLFIYIIMVISLWRLIEKKNIDGYKALIPVYNLHLLLDLADLPTYLLVLFFVPFAQIIFFFVVSFKIGDNFGKGIPYKVGLCLLPIIFYPLLAFSKSLYKEKEILGVIKSKDQNTILYNQFPDVTPIEEIKEENNILGTNTTNSDNLILNIDEDNTLWKEDKISENKKIVTIEKPIIKNDIPKTTTLEQVNMDEYIECPNCSTRLNKDATKCFLCGHNIN